MNERVPPELQPLIGAYLARVDDALPGLLTGFYVHGSLALGAFNARFSDIDFVGVVSREWTDSDVERLRDVHAAMARSFPQWLFDGLYVQAGDLARAGDVPAVTVHDGSVANGRGEISVVTRWELTTRGIAVRGAPPRDLPFTVDWSAVEAYMRENIDTYWAGWLRTPWRVVWLYTDDGFQWVVLGVLRLVYGFREQDVISKLDAGAYALGVLPRRWHRLIREAMNVHVGITPSRYRFKAARMIEAARFLRYVIRLCRAMG